jgi:outer membrane protein TolC
MRGLPWIIFGVGLTSLGSGIGLAQESAPMPRAVYAEGPVKLPRADASDQPFPITLSTALALARAQPLDIQIAEQRLQQALAQEEAARALWLPSLQFGVAYNRHDGQLQDVVGNILGTSKQSLFAGGGPTAAFAFTDALYAPLAARQVADARRFGVYTATNDVMVAVTDAYFTVQQARGEWAAAQDSVRRAEELVRLTEELAKGLLQPVEVSRTRTELARRRLAVSSAREKWRLASAQLTRLLRLEPQARVEPVEPPHLKFTMVDVDAEVDALIPTALTNRPELAAQQAFVQATLARLRQEKMRPLIPSLLLRNNSGTFGGGRNDRLADFSARNDFDAQLVWELQNLGAGNAARARDRRAENQVAMLELFQLEDRIAAEVVQAHAQVQESARRIADAEAGIKEALDSADKNFQGLKQTRRGADAAVILLIRPQEVVAAIQALQQALTDFYTAVADYDRAQFRLHRALGLGALAIASPRAGFQSGRCPCKSRLRLDC